VQELKTTTPGWVWALVSATLAGALIVDAATPLGVAGWVFYLVPVMLSIYGARPAMPLIVAAIATVLIGVGFVVSPSSVALSATLSYVNRAMIIVAMWTVAFVARQVIVARLNLRERDWVRTGQRNLATRMQGELDLNELADNVLSVLCTYLAAPVGAFYVTEPDGRLRYIAGYAAGGSAAPPGREHIAPGEGLLGQAVKERRFMQLEPAPVGYLDISSSLGHARPGRVLAVPAVTANNSFGAIELGFLEPTGPATVRLLEAVSEQIAIAIRSSLYRSRLEQLLEETQRQAETLQRQQEELKVQNEELENQSEVLRESEARLQAQQAELEQTNTQLEEQATAMEQQRDELARAQRELIEHSNKLARANAYKSEFLANMSHELRTPLNSALILAKVLAENKDGNLTPQQVKFAQTIYGSGNDLLELINQILDLSRIEAGALELDPAEVGLDQIIEPVVRTFQPVATQKELTFDVRLEPGLPDAIVTDRLRLQQILRNLLGNAFKFTDAGSVVLRVGRRGDRLRFDVQDTGAGIAAEQQQVIFEAFRQADGTTQRRHGGTGLGLTISRELAHRLGGEIEVESTLGSGSIFTLTLPVRLEAGGGREARDDARDAPRAAGAAPARAAGRGPFASAERRLIETSAAVSPARANRRLDPNLPAVEDDRDDVAAGAKSVLIIEDDVRFATILRDLAREQGFRSLVSTTADEGIALAEKFRPSGVVLDIELPDASGLTVLAHLKAHPSTRHIPIHIVSVTDQMQQAFELGAVGYALKPVQRDELIEALKKLEQKVEQGLRRVLVVEDVDAQRESIVALLSAEDVEIVPVATAEEALEQLNRKTFDCMVLDLTLRGTSGYELLDRMAVGGSFSFPPVIVYTGRTLTRDEELHLRRYASSIVIKGARSPERLLDEVTLFLHQVESRLPQDKQRMLREVRSRDAVLEGRTILLAEDDARNVFALASVLEPKGVTLRIARNGKEALDLLERTSRQPDEQIDLVLMDIMMPEMDGLTATQEIRRRGEWKRLPIIALTAKTMPDDREKCLQAGANDYIAKPLDVDKLVSLIKVWMPK